MKMFKLHYSEPLIRSAVWAFWRRVTGWRYFVAIALVLGSFIYSVSSGDRSWWVGVSASILCLAVIFAVALYVIHYRGAIIRFRRMQSPEATFEAGDDRFRVTSDVGSSELSWSTITEVWQFPEFWLLFLSRAQFITLPLADLDSEARKLILSRAKLHGAKVA
jgi:YcxB-like protein